MEWNKPSDSSEVFIEHYQTSKVGTARAHAYWFIIKLRNSYGVGYHGYGKEIISYSAGLFPTADAARAYIERKDADTIIISERVNA